ncbi:MAG: hypothetical protein ABJN39_10430 [Sulfitobacter sp.]|uniref:hypothetical protein n=1 Tax=Sulfitobacter sp. TaxID=1903071 RepID=UPI00329A5113
MLNTGSHAQPYDAYSLQIYTEDQTETDLLWPAILGNGNDPGSAPSDSTDKTRRMID